ncbi:hypothetical protein [Prevotella pallens]|uniref:hypothetical protein n=1 Tax=Prevotella pallens TaxID=60133 RepID=UPI001CB24083|nr:hypothetical protein [Prevotella pallens]MBF1483948.1 hypothetical protein [Prevotella pallens]MBF1506587.1 hypothetical protein [Prevotella pallens]
MKKYLFLLFVLLCCTQTRLMAQERKYYCEARCESKITGGCIIYLDFGDLQGEKFSFGKNNDAKPIDEQGKEINFPSTASFINWMVDKNWELVFKVRQEAAEAFITYTFSKITSKDKIKEGIRLKMDK